MKYVVVKIYPMHYLYYIIVFIQLIIAGKQFIGYLSNVCKIITLLLIISLIYLTHIRHNSCLLALCKLSSILFLLVGTLFSGDTSTTCYILSINFLLNSIIIKSLPK